MSSSIPLKNNTYLHCTIKYDSKKWVTIVDKMGNQASIRYGSLEGHRKRKEEGKEEEISLADPTIILLPPLFAVIPFPNVCFPPNPCLMTRLHRESLSYSILNRYMDPGITIISQSYTNARYRGSEVMASIMSAMDYNDMLSSWNTTTATPTTESITSDSLSKKNGNSNLFPALGKLHVSHKLYDNLRLHLSYESYGYPTISSSIQITPNLKLTSQFNDQGSGWLSCQFLTQVRNIFHESHRSSSNEVDGMNTVMKDNSLQYLHLHLGSWLDVRNNCASNTTKRWTSKSTTERIYLDHISAIHAYASIQVPGCLLAIQGRIPNTYDQFPDVSYYASVDLTFDNDTNENKNKSKRENKATLSHYSKTPPLTVVLQKSSKGTSLGLSQTIVWDRWILNPMEVREFPKIRNIMAWTVELESQQYSNNSKKCNDSNHYNIGHDDKVERQQQQQQHAVPKAGIVWQLNRSLAFKARISPQQWQSAILLQRWAHPRMMGSIIMGGSTTTGGLKFQGIHVGMEIGDSRNN
jgi:hypothetical protein